MTPTLPKILSHHVGISVPDIDDAIDWYQRMFGFELEMRAFIDIIPAEVAFVRRGDFRLELFQVEGAAPLPAERR